MKTLNDLFLGELADIHDAEHQLVKALGESKGGRLEFAGAKAARASKK